MIAKKESKVVWLAIMVDKIHLAAMRAMRVRWKVKMTQTTFNLVPITGWRVVRQPLEQPGAMVYATVILAVAVTQIDTSNNILL